jgi:hypothetical protein
LNFDEDDDDAYFETRDELLDEIEQASHPDARPRHDIQDVVGSISVFLDWRWNYSSGQLDDWSLGDIDDFLLDWLPRKYSAPPAAGADMCSAVADFFVHMGSRERLVGGVDRAAQLVARAYELTDEVVTAMADPANFGMAKSMFAANLTDGTGNPLADIGALLESGVDLDESALDAFMQDRIAAFNELPFEERHAITNGPGNAMVPRSRRVRIPVVNIPPTVDELDRSIGDSRLLQMIAALLDFVGPKGILVTQAGNLRLNDAERLVQLLGTEDVVARKFPWNDEPGRVRTSTDLVRLTLVFDVAEEAGAFIRLKTKVKVDPEWLQRSPAERAQLVIDALLAVGPVSSSSHWEIFYNIASLVEEGIPHWLSMALPEGAEIKTAPIVEQAVEVVHSAIPVWPSLFSDDIATRLIANQVSDVFGVLVLAGVVEWHDRVETTDAQGRMRESGGWLRLTPLGRHTMVDHIRAVGYDFPTLADLADGDAEDVVNTALTTGVDVEDLLGRWRPEASTADRAVALAEFAMSAEVAEQRLAAMRMLGMLEPVGDVEPAVCQMLDSKCAGHAALFLLERGLASPDEVAVFLDIGPLVDLLTTVLDEPDVLAQLFADMYERSDADLIEDLWRHAQPETIEVLQALGTHLADKKLAKAARKAAIKHRSWMANRNR